MAHNFFLVSVMNVMFVFSLVSLNYSSFWSILCTKNVAIFCLFIIRNRLSLTSVGLFLWGPSGVRWRLRVVEISFIKDTNLQLCSQVIGLPSWGLPTHLISVGVVPLIWKVPVLRCSKLTFFHLSSVISHESIERHLPSGYATWVSSRPWE